MRDVRTYARNGSSLRARGDRRAHRVRARHHAGRHTVARGSCRLHRREAEARCVSIDR